MTGSSHEGGFVPARPGRLRPSRGVAAPVPTAPSDFDAEEIARGQAAAVLGALGRMQLRLDVLAREQTEMFAKVLAMLQDVTESLQYEEDAPAQAAPEAPAEELPTRGW